MASQRKPRQIDRTPYTCKICGETHNVGGFRNHLQGKHPQYNTDSYVKEFGEFRTKHIHRQNIIEQSGGTQCLECGETVATHQLLMYHIKKHGMNYTDYHLKHIYNGMHPLCKCGCGSKVKIHKSGVIRNGERVFHSEYRSGHNTSMQVGVRSFSYESRMKMREAAIERTKRDGNYYAPPTSKPEHDICEFIRTLGVDAMHSDTSILRGMQLDVVVPDMKVAIEYNGLRFHSDIMRDRLYHKKKTEECELNGYRLVHIWEDWWHTKRNIVESMLRSLVNAIEHKIHARRCVVRAIDNETATKFLNENHIQGGSVSAVRYGLYHCDELVSVMTFGKVRRITGRTHADGTWELLRFCNKLDTVVIGGASKMFQHFVREHSPLSVISYANRDWSIGNVYHRMGFSFDGYTSVGYFYAKGKRRFSRSQYMKFKLVKDGYDPSKSEYEIMTSLGYYRVWNTGNLRFKWNPKS